MSGVGVMARGAGAATSGDSVGTSVDDIGTLLDDVVTPASDVVTFTEGAVTPRARKEAGIFVDAVLFRFGVILTPAEKKRNKENIGLFRNITPSQYRNNGFTKRASRFKSNSCKRSMFCVQSISPMCRQSNMRTIERLDFFSPE